MIHNFCKKCQWHHIRKGAAYNFVKGTIQHDVDIDVCIHPILDLTGKTDPVSGQKEMHVIKCSDRNKELNCSHFQPKMGILMTIFAILRGWNWADIYEAYQKRQPSRLEKPSA